MLVPATCLHAQLSTAAIIYINTYKNLAVAEMQRTGIPASITLAQGIHESESGTSDLVKRSNNHFGIKCKEGWTGGTVYHDDDSKGECFRSYGTAEDSYRDHSNFLTNSSRYAFLFKLDPTDFEGWAYGLKKAGYATNIRYSQLLIKLIKDYNLQQYTLIAMGRMKPSEEVVLTAPGAGSAQPLLVRSDGGAASSYPQADGAGPGNGSNAAYGNATGKRGSDMVTASQPAYPSGEFVINKTRVIYARSGTSLLAIANQYDLSLSRLLEFNDLKDEDILSRDQLLFLQRKRRTGAVEYHIVQQGESLYDISQSEGVRYRDVLDMNRLDAGAEPAVGERVWLQSSAPARPRLAETAGIGK